MTNSWVDLKHKFLGQAQPVFIYIGLNVLFFLVVKLFSLEAQAIEYLSFPADSTTWATRFYTILTYQFVHVDVFLLLFNSLWLYWMGILLLDFIKPHQFHVIYLGGIVVAAIFYATIVNLAPNFDAKTPGHLFGAQAGLIAILIATATLIPNYSIQLLFFGMVRIKFVVLIYIILGLATTISQSKIIAVAHIGAILVGFSYIKFLQNGIDWSNIFKRKPKLKVVRNEKPTRNTNTVNQKEIDAILDKISKSGYDNLSKAEKDTLFRASKN